MRRDGVVPDGGLIRDKPNVCPRAGNRAAFGRCECCKPVDSWNPVCLLYLDRSIVLVFVGLFNKASVDAGLAFLRNTRVDQNVGFC